MKAEHRKELETNELAQSVESLATGKTVGAYLNYRLIGLGLLVVLLVGAWWYASRQSREASSKLWSEFARPSLTQTDLEAQSQAGNVHARLELARNLYGPQGLALLSPLDIEQRNKGIQNIQKARDEFLALADLFKSDITLRASCLISAAEAELTLVGLPQTGTSEATLGSVTKAAELYQSAAETVGAKTELAEQYRKRAEELTADKARIEELGREIINRLAPAPSFNVGPNLDGPKAPLGPIPTPTPPADVKKEDQPKTPDTPKEPAKPDVPKEAAPKEPAPTTPAPKEPAPTTPVPEPTAPPKK